MTTPALMAITILLAPLAAAQLQESATKTLFVAKVKAAKTTNTFVHYKKGEGAHCLYDPRVNNAVPLVVWHDPQRDQVKLNDLVLKDASVTPFKIQQADCYAIYQHRKVFIVNTKTGQTGVIPIAKPRAGGAPR